MALFRTTEPLAEPVTVAELKAQLRIEHDGEDALLGGLLKAARAEVEQQTGAALLAQDWRLTLDEWPASGLVRLHRHPVREVLSVTMYGADGEASVLSPDLCQLDASSRPARLHLAERPAPERRMNGIEIDFACGYGESGADVPDLLKRAIIVLASHWFEFRASYRAAEQPVSMPAGFDRLVAPFRSTRL